MARDWTVVPHDANSIVLAAVRAKPHSVRTTGLFANPIIQPNPWQERCPPEVYEPPETFHADSRGCSHETRQRISLSSHQDRQILGDSAFSRGFTDHRAGARGACAK